MDALIGEYIVELQEIVLDYLPMVTWFLSVVLVGLVLGEVLKRLLRVFEARVVKKTETDLDDLIFKHINEIAVHIFYSIVTILAFKSLGMDVTHYVIAVLAILVAGDVAKLIGVVIGFFEERLVKRTPSGMDDVVFSLLKRTVGFVVYTFAIIIALDELGIEVVPFIAGLGIMGIAVGFAAKDTLANIIAGIFIIIDRPFVLGDRIEIWSAPKQAATWGDVVDIGLRTTKINTTDNIILIIPNSEIYKRDIINYTTETPKIRVRLGVGISYDSDIQKAEDIMLAIADETEGVEKKPEPWVLFKQFGDSSIDLELRMWITEAQRRRRITSAIGKRMKEEFDKQGIEIPYPQRVVYMKGPKGD